MEMTDSFKQITSNFNDLSSKMDRRTSEILSTAKEQEAGAAQQAATVSEVTSTMEELAATARQIAQNAESVTNSAEQAAQAVEDGRESLFAFVQSMNSIETGNRTINDNIVALNRHVQQIRGIIDLINDIADRTDLLALNAALEGTKAGEAGKGFLLVAAEMRRLAENVFSSTAEIKQLIAEVTEATNATVMANESGMRATREGTERAGEAERAFGRIVDTIEETSKAAKQISLATQQQHTGTDQIVAAMGEVSSVAQQGVEGIRSTTQAVGELSATASQLKQLVSKYQM
jgi:methyl-accepting chemotaxis protein